MSALQDTLKKIVEGQDLTKEEAKTVFNEIMTGQVSEAQIAAWITALRMKGETADELAGCIEIMRQEVLAVKCNDHFAVDSVGTGGDGAHTINISTTAAFVAAGAGITVAKHGNRAVSSKSGSADVLSQLGINLDITPEKMEACLNNIGFSFLFAPKLHPAMKHAIGARRAIGIRTIFNLLGPMTNPANTTRGVIGVFSEKYCYLLAEAAHKTGADHYLFVHGSDGLDEITLTGSSTIIEVKGKEIKAYKFNPKEYGFNLCKTADFGGGTPEENAEYTRQILSGKEQGAKRDIVVINAAATILVSGKAADWNEAIKMAKQSIDSGAAAEKMKQFAEASQQA